MKLFISRRNRVWMWPMFVVVSRLVVEALGLGAVHRQLLFRKTGPQFLYWASLVLAVCVVAGVGVIVVVWRENRRLRAWFALGALAGASVSIVVFVLSLAVRGHVSLDALLFSAVYVLAEGHWIWGGIVIGALAAWDQACRRSTAADAIG